MNIFSKFSIVCDQIFLVGQQGKFEIEHFWDMKGLENFVDYICAAGDKLARQMCVDEG